MDRTDSGLVIFILLVIIGLMVVVNQPPWTPGVVVSIDNRINTAPAPVSGCQNWYSVRQGETQWTLARRYGKPFGIHQWLRDMRKVSGKNAADEGLRIGEQVCVRWWQI